MNKISEKCMVNLRVLSSDDVKYFYNWINDDESIKYSLTVFQRLQSETDIDKWFSKLLDDSGLCLGIEDIDTGKLIGYAGICSISDINMSGEYYIFIGDKRYWNRGIGTYVTNEILKIGFTEYKLNRIMLTVSDINGAGVKAYEKAGFIYEGRMRKACYRDEVFHDKLIMSVLREEWIDN